MNYKEINWYNNVDVVYCFDYNRKHAKGFSNHDSYGNVPILWDSCLSWNWSIVFSIFIYSNIWDCYVAVPVKSLWITSLWLKWGYSNDHLFIGNNLNCIRYWVRNNCFFSTYNYCNYWKNIDDRVLHLYGNRVYQHDRNFFYCTIRNVRSDFCSFGNCSWCVHIYPVLGNLHGTKNHLLSVRKWNGTKKISFYIYNDNNFIYSFLRNSISCTKVLDYNIYLYLVCNGMNFFFTRCEY